MYIKSKTRSAMKWRPLFVALQKSKGQVETSHQLIFHFFIGEFAPGV